MPPVSVIGLSHKTAPVEVRERLAIPMESLGEKLQFLLEGEELRELMILSTCNRVEIYFVPRDIEKGEEVVRRFLKNLSGGEVGDLFSSLYAKRGVEAVSHLFRVTSGIDSMVVGESQITGQVKEAYTVAAETGATGPILNKWVHKAFNVAKKVRSETGIGTQPVSVSSAAVFLAEKIFGDLSEKSVLLIGAGEMGELASQQFVSRGAKNISIANRTLTKAEELAKRFGGNAVSLSQVREALKTADVVLVSTGSEDFLITSDEVREIMRARGNEPLFIVDIAVPRNVEEKVNIIENVYLYNVDDLESVVDESRSQRAVEAGVAEKIIADETVKFVEELQHWELSPVLKQLSFKFEGVRLRELDKAFRRMKGLTEEDKRIVDRCTESIVSKILHDPILQLKAEGGKEDRHRYLNFIKKLFDLPE